MTAALPGPIAAYVRANAGLDAAGMLAAFAPDATVADEGRRHVGQDAIRAWIEQATLGNRAIWTPGRWHEEEGVQIVAGVVSGEFPGSPVALTFRFRLAQGAIAGLEIA